MKVLFVCSGSRNGNPGIVVYNQAMSLKKKGIDIQFFLIEGKGLKSYISAILPLYKVLKNAGIDIVHSHYSLSSFVTTIAKIFPRVSKIPHIVSLMGSDTKLEGLNKLLVQLSNRFFWNVTIVKSKSMCNELGIKDPCIIPNGVDLNSIKCHMKPNESKKINEILFAADPSRESKNFKLAQAALKLLDNENVKLNVINNVTHKQIIEEINKNDVLLLTSKWEGSPNIIKEAMACNCPIVATNVGDVEWLLGSVAGHYLTSFAPEDVADKIHMALMFAKEHGNTRGRERLIKLGLDSDNIAKRIITIYESILSHGK